MCQATRPGSRNGRMCAAKNVCEGIVGNITGVVPSSLCEALEMCPGDACEECLKTTPEVIRELQDLLPARESCSLTMVR